MFEELYNELHEVFFYVCHKSRLKHQDEHFYSVGLYRSGNYRYFEDSLSTIEGLATVARKLLAEPSHQSE